MGGISHFFQTNLDVVFFLYGLSFVVTGLVILAQLRHRSELALAGVLWLFVAYAFSHAPADFLDMFAASRGYSLQGPQLILTALSYLFLFEFGRRLLIISGFRLPSWFLPVILAVVALISLLSSDRLATFHILIGYLIRLPAGIFAGTGLLLYFRSHRELFESLRLKRHFVAAVISLFAWSFFCGVIRAEGQFFPATHINIGSFAAVAGLPVHVFRTICALIAAWSFFGILKVFDWELKERQDIMLQELQEALASVKTLQGLLPICSFCKKIRDDRGNWTQIELYVSRRSDAQFSHGLCPDCAQEHYSHFYKKS